MSVGTHFRAPLSTKNLAGAITALTDSNGLLLAGESPTKAAAAAPIGISGLRVAHAIFDFSVDGGVTGLITPISTASIPINAIIIGGTIDVIAAVTSLGSATLSVGTSAGSSASALLAATAKASLTLAAILNAVPTLAVPVKMTAAGNITVTVGAADATAGKIEIFMYFVVATNA